MKDLVNIKNVKKANTITTLEIAEMMETEHKEILKKLEGTTKPDGSIKQIGIIPVLTKRNFPLSDYFSLSSYKDASGKTNKCYKVTRLGCDFLANKFTGEKGILFTARYVKRFNEMEEEIKTHNYLSEEEKLKLQLFSKDALEVVTAHNRLVEMEVEKVKAPLLGNIAEQKEVIIQQSKTIEKQDHKLELQKPFVQAVIKLQNTDGTVSLKEASDMICGNGLQIGRNTMMALLRKHKILTKNNEAINRYVQQDIFRVVQTTKVDQYGKTRIFSTTRVTAKGLIYLNTRVKEWLGVEQLDDFEKIISNGKYAWLELV